ncbi:PaaI family thioesterase [Thioclava sp. GXIMD4216]|uniref:PaaI family thioesterase n=1 Tax=Thioclava litoralis TaxID=3076557 RepID=A0ABZ1E011_9RHOB|nr:PaaI family thioesterase [Thioclava sp. FTW29]
MKVVDVSSGKARMVLPYNEKLIGDPETGVIHGGAVSVLMDTCCATAVMAHPSQPRSTATLDLRIDYMRPAKPGQSIVASAEVYHISRSIAFVRAVAHDESDASGGVPVAQATAAFTVYLPEEAKA